MNRDRFIQPHSDWEPKRERTAWNSSCINSSHILTHKLTTMTFATFAFTPFTSSQAYRDGAAPLIALGTRTTAKVLGSAAFQTRLRPPEKRKRAIQAQHALCTFPFSDSHTLPETQVGVSGSDGGVNTDDNTQFTFAELKIWPHSYLLTRPAGHLAVQTVPVSGTVRAQGGITISLLVKPFKTSLELFLIYVSHMNTLSEIYYPYLCSSFSRPRTKWPKPVRIQYKVNNWPNI